MVWYHGSPVKYDESISKHGLCPPRRCPIEVETHGDCRPNTVYLSRKFEVAQFIGLVKASGEEGLWEGLPAKSKAYVYKILRIPKGCSTRKDTFDPADFKSIRVVGCGCIKPGFKCLVADKLSPESDCKWEKA